MSKNEWTAGLAWPSVYFIDRFRAIYAFLNPH